jgi:hypothetical protein
MVDIDEQKLTNLLIHVYGRYVIDPNDKSTKELAFNLNREYEGAILHGLIKNECIGDAITKLYSMDESLLDPDYSEKLSKDEALSIIVALKKLKEMKRWD